MRENIFNAATSTLKNVQRFVSDALYLVVKHPELATAFCLFAMFQVGESLLIFYSSDESLQGGAITMCPAGVIINNEGFKIDPDLGSVLYEKCGFDRNERPSLYRVWNCLRKATTLFMLNPHTLEPLVEATGTDLCDPWLNQMRPK